MPVVEHTIVIPRSPERVFEFLNDADQVPLWDRSIVKVHQLSELLGIGTRLRGTSAILGRKFDWVTEVVEYDPPRHMVSRTVEGKVNFTVSFDLAPVGTHSTRLTFRVAADTAGDGIFGRFADSFIEKRQAKNAQASLDRLSRLLREEPSRGDELAAG